MQCPVCNSEIKNIPAGVSKKTGKSYNAFSVCSNPQCGFKPTDETGKTSQVRETIRPKPDEFVEGKKENTRLMKRADLVIEVYKLLGQTTDTHQIKLVADDLWGWIEK